MTTLNRVDFEKAYYIKLGETGQWEKSSLAEGKLRIGWAGQALDDIKQGRWEIIPKQLAQSQKDKGAVTRDLNALRKICESTSQDVWMSFSGSRLWWCRVGPAGILEDATSKYRTLLGSWSDRDVNGNVLSMGPRSRDSLENAALQRDSVRRKTGRSGSNALAVT